MNLDLFVDTSRKGISMGMQDSDSGMYLETVDDAARGETASAILDELLVRAGAKLDHIRRVLVTLGPGSFSGLRTGVAFCQGLCFSGNRKLYGVSTLQALECFSVNAESSEGAAHETRSGSIVSTATVIIRARPGYWYMRQTRLDTAEESFISTEEVLARLEANTPKRMVLDDAVLADESIAGFIRQKNIPYVNEKNQKLSAWTALFDVVPPGLIQEANYIQPSYFEKLK
ncbi:MAG: tRNA (adenosine(37)-N6)-threonylcarbamoyltransferase complex dimerization subunit type 1 TsaB [Fibrobacter sp.]|nr:tRNA (adenosine(37)-N6)-threonylcarbamoyltransferase complex dimerization subunit type 1 TsaB [Fibrobacter sp.]